MIVSEYIKLEDAIKELQNKITYRGEPMPDGYFKFVLKDIPSADVVEVRHGRWLRVGQGFFDPNEFLCFECSICRCMLDNHIKVEQNYCPNCGARMDG